MKLILAGGRAFDTDHAELVVSMRSASGLHLKLQPLAGAAAGVKHRHAAAVLKAQDGSEVELPAAGAPAPKPVAEWAPVEALHFAPWSAGQVYYGNRGEAVWAPSVGDSRDQLAALLQHHSIELKPFASIAWGETFQDMVVVAWRITETALEVEESAGTGNLSDRVETVLPGFRARYGARTAAKAELVTQVNPLDSLAALEQQLDLVTDLLVKVSRTFPLPPHLVSMADQLEQIIASHGAHRGRGAGQALEAIASHKAGLREKQARYFRRRDGR